MLAPNTVTGNHFFAPFFCNFSFCRDGRCTARNEWGNFDLIEMLRLINDFSDLLDRCGNEVRIEITRPVGVFMAMRFHYGNLHIPIILRTTIVRWGGAAYWMDSAKACVASGMSV